jgi:hypothetical protein
MISNFSTPSIASSGSSSTGGTDKTVLLITLLIGGFLVYRYIIKPEMDKQKNQTNESTNINDQFE